VLYIKIAVHTYFKNRKSFEKKSSCSDHHIQNVVQKNNVQKTTYKRHTVTYNYVQFFCI